MQGSLDDYRLFLAIADAGSLALAAEATGQSAPTLSRRMAALERRLATRLFERGKRGYTLTSAGRALLAEAEPLRQAAARLQAWPREDARPRVRLTAGHWTLNFIARNLAHVWTASAGWTPEFLASNAVVDIARREADIGIRNRAPTQPWLAGRRTGTVAYAPFASTPDVTGYLALPEDAPGTPSTRWVRANNSAEIVTTVSDMRLATDLALSGMGRVVLPVFAGDANPGLIRVGPTIDAIAHEEWLVSHHDARHDPPIRAAIDALTALLTDRSLRRKES